MILLHTFKLRSIWGWPRIRRIGTLTGLHSPHRLDRSCFSLQIYSAEFPVLYRLFPMLEGHLYFNRKGRMPSHNLWSGGNRLFFQCEKKARQL